LVVLLLLNFYTQPVGAEDAPSELGNAGTLVSNIDTTKTRDVKPRSKSTIQVISDAPGFVLGAPFKVLKYTVKGLVYAAYKTPVRGLASLGNPISPFFVVAGYGSNSGFKGGIGYRLKNILALADRFAIKNYYSTHQYQSYQIKYQAPDLLSESTSFYFESRYKKRPWESFYGIGMDTRVCDEAVYTLEQFITTGTARRAISERAHFSLSAGFSATNIFAGQDDSRVGDIDSIQVLFDLTSDHFRATRYISFGGQFEFDWRDQKGQTSRGGMIDIEATYNHGVGRSDDLKFVIMRAEISQYLEIWRKRVVACRILAGRHDNLANDRVSPFYLQSSLGGIDDLRGYQKNRFLDNDIITASVEYRWPIWRVIDAYLFLDEGRSFQDAMDGFTTDGWQYSFGGGLRVWNSNGVTLSTLLAKSKEQTRFYFELGASW
jgi:outer membrane protein assembly factor BamA